MTATPSTKETLIQVARDLFAAKGFHAASIRELADAAGTNVASVNYHFGDKFGLFEAVLNAHFEEVRAEMEEAKFYQKGPKDQLLLLNQVLQKILLSKGNFCRMVYHVLMSQDQELRKIAKVIIDRHMKPMMEHLQFSSAKCRFKGDKSKALSPNTFVFLIMAVNAYWFLFSGEMHSLFGKSSKALLDEAFASVNQLMGQFTEES